MKKKISAKEVAKVFGFGKKVKIAADDGQIQEEYIFDDINVGMMDWPFYQTAAAFSQAYPHIFGDTRAHCMVVYAIDQDNYFRMARDVASKMNLIKPCSIMSMFLDPLNGPAGKMSSSTNQDSTIFLTDNPQTIKKKIGAHAFSGGGGDGSLSDHRMYGGNPDIDIPCKFLKYFEYDDNKLNNIYTEFRKGNLTCSDTKNILVDILTKIILEHQNKRNLVTDQVIEDFYKQKKIALPKPVKKECINEEKQLYDIFDILNIKYNTKYHGSVRTLEERYDVMKKIKGVFCKNILLIGEKNYLYVADMNTETNIKALCKKLREKKLRFADKNKFQDLLNVEPEYANVFSLMNNVNKNICVLIDDNLKDSYVNFQPMRNDATTLITYNDMLKFLDHIKYEPIFV